MSSFSFVARVRRRHLSLIAAAAAVPLAVGALQAIPAGAAPAGRRPGASGCPADPSSTHRVTLVTGDVVTVTTRRRPQIADVDRPDGRRRRRPDAGDGGDLYVVPDEAVGLLGADKLDPRLFDVTDLIAMGYDDAGTGRVPMIATYTRAAARAAGAPPAPAGSTIVRRLAAMRGAALTAPKPRTRTFWKSVAPKLDAADPTPTLGAASPSCGWTARCRPTSRRACRRSAPRRRGRPGSTAPASRWPCSTPASTSTTPTWQPRSTAPPASCRARP